MLIKIDGYYKPIRWQSIPSIQEMTMHYAAPERAMCKKVAESGRVPYEFVLALYADYMLRKVGYRK